MSKESHPQTFSKRVAFLISDQSLIQTGGIGQFTKAFVEMAADQNWLVDLILDKKSTSTELIDQFRDKIGRIVAPIAPLSYAGHTETFAFTDSVNFEKQLNFRNAFMIALQDVMYDLIICNVPEAYMPVYSTGLTKYIPTIFYTHNESMVGLSEDTVGPYSKEYLQIYRKMFTLPNVYIGTQSQTNVERMKGIGIDAINLPMPITERALQESSANYHKSGVLYIGRWEERKNPKEYLRLIKETKLPAKVMTNRNGGGKFEAAFREMGILEWHIGEALAGQAKVDFIKGSKVFYNPTVKESFCYTMLEALGHTHAVALSEYDWSVEFANYPNVRRVPKAMAVDTVRALYDTEPDPNATDRIRKYHQDAISRWIAFVEGHGIQGSQKNRSEVSKKSDTWFADHIDTLQRFASVEDLESCYKACGAGGFTLVHTSGATWLTRVGTPVPAVNSSTYEDIFS